MALSTICNACHNKHYWVPRDETRKRINGGVLVVGRFWAPKSGTKKRLKTRTKKTVPLDVRQLLGDMLGFPLSAPDYGTCFWTVPHACFTRSMRQSFPPPNKHTNRPTTNCKRQCCKEEGPKQARAIAHTTQRHAHPIGALLLSNNHNNLKHVIHIHIDKTCLSDRRLHSNN